MTSNVCVPIDPVAPNKLMFFITPTPRSLIN